MLKHIKISYQLLFLLIIALLSIGVVTFWSAQFQQKRMLDDRKKELAHLVQSAYSIMQAQYDRGIKENLSPEESKKKALDVIETMRYNKVEYFWVHEYLTDTTKVPTTIMHPIMPALNGKALDAPKFSSAYQLQSGLNSEEIVPVEKGNIFATFNKAVSLDGAGFVWYLWNKPLATGGATEELFPKLSFVQHFKPWNLVIGSGVYIDDIEQQYQAYLKNSIKISGAIAAGLVLLMTFILLSIILPLKSLTNTVIQISKNKDLTKRSPVRGSNELGLLSTNLNSLLMSFDNLIKSLHHQSMSVTENAQAIHGFSSNVDERSAQQNERTSLIAQSIEQLSRGVSEIERASVEGLELSAAMHKSASDGYSLMQEAEKISNKAAEKVQQSSVHMQQLHAQALDISNISQWIQEIASQTNLLALNAAIEAARAGDAGRGFAVVADEVRKLAEKTSEATVQINNKIEAIKSETQHVVQSGTEISELMQKNTLNTKQVSVKVAEFEQTSGHLMLQNKELKESIVLQSGATTKIAESLEGIGHRSDWITKTVSQIQQQTEELLETSEQLEASASEYKSKK